MEEFGWARRRRKLKVNVTKSKIMRSVIYGIFGEMNILVDDQVLYKVKVLNHLGSLVTSEIQQRDFWRGVKYWEQ